MRGPLSPPQANRKNPTTRIHQQEAQATMSIRFIMIGGFLGAGKTTAIGRLAKTYQDRGQRVGIVTNDQASDLVDTHTLRSQGFEVGEVAGACFCCNFNELTDVVGRLEARQKPDVVIAEPVGSCTDLVATVVQPIMRLYNAQFDVAPYGVILKPSHGRRILSGSERGFSPKAAYIFKKQLEEADFVIINRIDELEPAEVDELEGLIKQERPDVPVLRLSAKTGESFEGLLEMLDQRGAFGRNILELDYDVYAEGEAELGWLNSSLRVNSEKEFPLDELLVDIVDRLRTSLAESDAEPAHLKTIGLWEGYHGVANLISSDSVAELSLASDCRTRTADVVVNARVATAPETLTEQVEQAVHAACAALGATAEFRQTQSFRPGRPVPTHRYSQPLSE
jgi:Ni2+-binding GTPase involved in maturation of urease and hydrogenase